MKRVYTIGFTKKNAETFFEILRDHSIDVLIDTRINNTSQLAGFTKEEDLKYFLKKICGIDYIYRPDFAPTKELLKEWRDKRIKWEQYERQYLFMLENRGTYKKFLEDFANYDNVCLLCSESTPEHCHRRLLAEKLKIEFPNEVKVIHI